MIQKKRVEKTSTRFFFRLLFFILFLLLVVSCLMLFTIGFPNVSCGFWRLVVARVL